MKKKAIQLNKQDIKDELEKLLAREGYSHKELAQEIHVRESTISNWMRDPKRSIPVDKLIFISKNFNDLRFKRAVGDYLTEMPTIFGSNAQYKQDSASLYLAAQRDESERKSMDRKTVMYFAMRADEITDKERRYVIQWLKGFSKEISDECSLRDTLFDEFEVNPLELEIAR